jgi:hypothetical protein
VLATGASDGKAYLYDLVQSSRDPVASITVASKAAVVAVQFSPVKGEALLATADTSVTCFLVVVFGFGDDVLMKGSGGGETVAAESLSVAACSTRAGNDGCDECCATRPG